VLCPQNFGFAIEKFVIALPILLNKLKTCPSQYFSGYTSEITELQVKTKKKTFKTLL